jgi:pyruvate, orthophosphate dikinase
MACDRRRRDLVTWVYAYDHPHDLEWGALKALIGSKAANISTMAVKLGLPVPPAFTISTEACNAYLRDGWPDGLDGELREHMAHIEARVGRRFGDPADPLLVSVRSGAPLSMPGMMDTILNLGLNGSITAGFARVTGDGAFAADCRDRFVRVYRDIVGVEDVPEDPWLQLRAAVEAVFRSWNSDRARAYRAHEGIGDDLGTGVTVQAMVFGNRGSDSGTGVLFTRNPATGEPVLFGDVMFNAQGEDVVAGTHGTEPIAVLDERMPAVAAELRRYSDALEHYFADCCDIEFTIEQGRLWMLQVRVGKRSPQAALRMAVDMAEDPSFPLTRAEAVGRVAHLLADPPRTTLARPAGLAPIGTGLGASPGVGSGEIATTPEAAERVADAGRSVILVRSETSPDDVHGMARAAGILTAQGGLASHAAVVARGWGIPAVVGARALEVRADGIAIGGRALAIGETITVDGSTGEVFEGIVTGRSQVVPEAGILLGWAAEAGIAIGAGAANSAATVEPATEASATAGPRASALPVTQGAVLRALAIKGFATAEGLGDAVRCSAADAQPVLDGLVAGGLVEPSAGAFRLTAAGKERGLALLAEDRDRCGADRALAALDAFLALDGRMKETVTAWQMREVGGTQTFNDHSDAAYDAGVLERLAALHGEADAWLAPLVAGLPRLEAYRARLAHAADCARAGDGRYVASPRVDSYHGAWFELHEDLIQLAGKTRAEEVAAGRA